MVSNVQSKPSLVHLCAFLSKKYLFFLPGRRNQYLSLPLRRKLKREKKFPYSLLFFQTRQMKCSSLPSQDIPSSPFTSFVVFLWIHFSSLLNCVAQNCPQYPRWGRTNAEYSSTITSLSSCWCCVLGTPGCGLPCWLTRAPCWPCCWPAALDPFLQGFSPAIPAPIYTCAWCYSILAAESITWTS